MGVLCKSYTIVDRRHKVMVLRNDNLDKQKGKRSCISNGVLLPYLKVVDMLIKLDNHVVTCCKLRTFGKQAGTTGEQVVEGLN